MNGGNKVRKSIKIVIIVLLCLVALLLIWHLTDCATLRVGNEETNISFRDSWQLRWLLLMKKTDFQEYGCGFSEDYSIKMGGLTYCLAQDDCNTVYIKELNLYYEIFGRNHAWLHRLLWEYGG